MKKTVYELLQEWYELFEVGAISESEYLSKKMELLNNQNIDNPKIDYQLPIRSEEEQRMIDEEFNNLFEKKSWLKRNLGWFIGILITLVLGLFLVYKYNESTIKPEAKFIENPDLDTIATERNSVKNNSTRENTSKIFSSTIWSSLYPNYLNFDTDSQLNRTIIRVGEEFHFKTIIGKYFYYVSNGINKVTVILFSYDYTDGEKADCHACHPEMEIATFKFTGEKWIKEKFIQNWKESSGAWGEPPEIEFKAIDDTNCLITKFNYSARGNSNTIITYYNLETLKKIRSEEQNRYEDQ